MILSLFRKDFLTSFAYTEGTFRKGEVLMNTDCKKLYRTEGPYAKLAGVCGGVAEYFGIDPTMVRL
ncbi:MAG: PspC domain-containing protein, partial [Oscillospiraceae bacterium]